VSLLRICGSFDIFGELAGRSSSVGVCQPYGCYTAEYSDMDLGNEEYPRLESRSV